MKQKLLKSLLLLCAFIVGSIAWADSETITFASLGLENGVQYTDPFGTNVSVTFGGGSNDGKYYNTGSGIRTYGNGTITITAKGNTVTAVETTFAGETYAPASDDVWTSDGTGKGTSGTSASWEGSATEVVMTRPSGSGHWRLQAITVTYTTGGGDEPEKVETFSYEDHQGKGKIDSGSSYTMWGIDVSITNDKFYGSTVAPYAYFYGYAAVGTGTTLITPHNGATITKVEIMTYDTDHNGWQIIGTEDPGEITASVGTVTANNEDKTKATMTTWTGSASEQITLTNTRTIAWSSIKVYYTGGLPKCATPVISGETSFITYSTVSISCETEGATIQYSTTTDGVNYTAYQTYTGPFQVSQTTTVKAQATKEGMVPSDEAYKAFVQHDVIPNIGYFISSHATVAFSDPEYLRLEDALVTYKNGNTAYIEDAYRAIMLYNCAGAVEAGDKINGYMKVTGYNPSYNGLPEITGFELVEGYVKTQEPEVNPTVVTLAQLLNDPVSSPYEMYLSKYVKIENATVTSAFASKNCTIEQGAYSITLRDQNSTATLTSTAGDNVTVTGFVAIYGTTKQIAVYEQSQIVVTAVPAIPTISVNPSSLTGFAYGVGNGPSAAQSFTVSGTNLTADITLNLDNNNYEMSLTEGNGYAYSLTLPQSEGTVAATPIFVRLRAGLEMNPSYSGSIAITSKDATSKSVTLAGSVETPYIAWDLSKDETATATESEMTWTSTYATMAVAKGTATTATNSYYPGTPEKNYTSTRFYKNSVLTVTPATGYAVKKVVFEATSNGYASALASSGWTNASAKANETTVTVTPKDPTTAWSATIGGTCGFTSVKVYYEEAAPVPSIALNYNSVNFPVGGGDGTIDVTYNNIKNVNASIVWYSDEKATVTTTEPDWISAEINSNKNLYYVVGENDGAARTAYLKVYTKDDDANDVYSELITITQEAYVPPTPVSDLASVTFDFTDAGWGFPDSYTKTEETYTNGGYTVTLGTSSNGHKKMSTNGIIFGKKDATISLPAFDFNVSKIKVSGISGASGKVTYNVFVGSDAVSTEVTGATGVYEFAIAADKQAAETIYTIKTTNDNNCQISKIEVFGYVPVTVGEAGYTTFWTMQAKAKALSYEGVQAFVVTSINANNVALEEITTAPAWTPVIIKADAGVHNLAVIPSAPAVEGNLLQPSRGTNVGGESSECDYYALSDKEHGVGFYKVGDGITIPAGKAYLQVQKGASIKEFLGFEDGADSVNSLTPALSEGEGAIYNVAGQRLSKMQKGINIVNGKKYLK